MMLQVISWHLIWLIHFHLREIILKHLRIETELDMGECLSMKLQILTQKEKCIFCNMNIKSF